MSKTPQVKWFFTAWFLPASTEREWVSQAALKTAFSIYNHFHFCSDIPMWLPENPFFNQVIQIEKAELLLSGRWMSINNIYKRPISMLLIHFMLFLQSRSQDISQYIDMDEYWTRNDGRQLDALFPSLAQWLHSLQAAGTNYLWFGNRLEHLYGRYPEHQNQNKQN